MKITKTYGGIALIGTILFFLAAWPAQSQSGAGEVNLLSWGRGRACGSVAAFLLRHRQLVA